MALCDGTKCEKKDPSFPLAWGYGLCDSYVVTRDVNSFSGRCF